MVGAELLVPCGVVRVGGDVELNQSVIVEEDPCGGGERQETGAWL